MFCFIEFSDAFGRRRRRSKENWKPNNIKQNMSE